MYVKKAGGKRLEKNSFIFYNDMCIGYCFLESKKTKEEKNNVEDTEIQMGRLRDSYDRNCDDGLWNLSGRSGSCIYQSSKNMSGVYRNWIKR